MSKTKEMVAEPKTENKNADCCVCNESKPNYDVCYKSKLLNKVFDTTEELAEAERKYHEENDAKLKLAEQKKERAEAIKVLKQKTFEARREAQKIINEADEAYYKARAEFIKDYGSYHESYYSDGKNEVVTINDLIDSFFKPWF